MNFMKKVILTGGMFVAVPLVLCMVFDGHPEAFGLYIDGIKEIWS